MTVRSTTTVRDLVAKAKAHLRDAPHQPPGREAHLLLGHVLSWSESQVRARDDTVVTDLQAQAFSALIERRLRGEPVAYLTGRKEFFGRSFAVDDRVLIPRPETEHLIEAALALDLPVGPRMLDIATGSGCIGLTLALELGASRALLTDRSLAALAVARANATALDAAGRVRLLCTDWVAGVDLAAIDLVVSNPPYVAPADAAELSPEITDFEPSLALYAGAHGLAAYEAIFAGLEGLRSGTPVLCEVGRGQSKAVIALARRHRFTYRQTVADYAGIERVVVLIRGPRERTLET